jgi:mono/diheme cytochrome c family protein
MTARLHFMACCRFCSIYRTAPALLLQYNISIVMKNNPHLFAARTGIILLLVLIMSSFTRQSSFSSANGEELYRKNCKHCHGTDGTKGWLGAKNLKVSNLTTPAIIRQISEGKGWMPSFKKKFTPEELNQLADYVKTLRQNSI